MPRFILLTETTLEFLSLSPADSMWCIRATNHFAQSPIQQVPAEVKEVSRKGRFFHPFLSKTCAVSYFVFIGLLFLSLSRKERSFSFTADSGTNRK